MKKINFLAIIAAVLVVIIIAVTLFFVFGNRTEKDNSGEILNCSTVADVKEYIEQNKIESYSFDTDYCYIGNISVLGSNSDVEFLFKNEATIQISVLYPLFQCIDENASEKELESFDVMSYEFTQNDKKDITNAFDKVKKGVENKLGCTLEKYDLIPTQNGLEIEDNEDKFYQGLFVREYSVRDRSGTLWLLRFEASYGLAQATLIKVVDDSGYEGFIPAIDMTKE